MANAFNAVGPGVFVGDLKVIGGDLYLDATRKLDFGAGNLTLTHSPGILTMNAGELRIYSGTDFTVMKHGFFEVSAGVNVYYGTFGVNQWAVMAASGNWVPDAAGTRGIGLGGVGIKQIFFDYTNTATVGNVTINKPSGRVNIAAAGTSVVVTNSLVTAASHVFAVMSTNDATGRVTSVVPAAGSFTINTVATTAQASFDFVIINAD